MDAAADAAPVEDPARPSIKWDEEGLAAHESERGVKYGTMKVDHPETPYLYYDEETDPIMGRHRGSGEPQQMSVEELQRSLGLLKGAEGERFTQPKWGEAEARDEFLAQRQAMYAGEAELAALNAGLPDGWRALRSRSEPAQVFYFHEDSHITQWERPDAVEGADDQQQK